MGWIASLALTLSPCGAPKPHKPSATTPSHPRVEYPSIQAGTFDLFPPVYLKIHRLVRRLSQPLAAEEIANGWTEQKRQMVFEQAYELETNLSIDTPLSRRLLRSICLRSWKLRALGVARSTSRPSESVKNWPRLGKNTVLSRSKPGKPLTAAGLAAS